MSSYNPSGLTSDPVIFDILDPPEMQTSAAASNGFLRRGVSSAPTATAFLAPVLDNAVAAWTVQVFQNALWQRASSLAATRQTKISSRWWFPTQLNPANDPPGGRLPLQYELSHILQRTTPLVAVAPLAFSLVYGAGTHGELSDVASAGYELVSRSDLNGGRWTVRVRQVNAGALTVVQDTGIDPANGPIFAKLIFRSVLNSPRLSFLIGQGTTLAEFGVVSGYANMPLGNGNLQTQGIVQGLGVGGGAGQVDRVKSGRFTVRELAGFPT
jgi:hypothetical protein